MVWCVALAGRRAFGGPAAALAVLLALLSPFYQTYTRLVMAEMATAAIFAAMAVVLAGWPARADAGSWRGATGRGAALGVLLAGATTVRLANVQAGAAVLAALLLGPAAGRRRALLACTGAFTLGMAPLLAYQWTTFGSPLRTGYHLWTPDWAGAGRAVFHAGYALRAPALPSGAMQPNLAHYLAAWLGLPARGDAGEPVPSPVHTSLAAPLAMAAVAGTWSGLRRPPSRPVAAFITAGVAAALVAYGAYFYQDVRFIAPWAPLWLLLAAAGIVWGAGGIWAFASTHWSQARVFCPAGVDAVGTARASSAVASLSTAIAGGTSVALLVAVAIGAPAVVTQAPLWQRVVERRPAPVPPRLAQLQALAREAPPDAWIITAIDGPLVDYYALRGTQRRYLALARGLEFVDKPPFRRVPAAPEARAAIGARLAATSDPIAAGVIIDRWSLEFAERLPAYRAELDRVLAGLELWPGGAGAPVRPSFYIVAPAGADRGVSRYALRDGEPLRGSGDAIFVYERGYRRHLPSIAAFLARGLRWEDVRRLPDVVLEAIPVAPPLS
jgi:hypothetical protein